MHRTRGNNDQERQISAIASGATDMTLGHRHRMAILALDRMVAVEVGMPFLVFGAPHLSYEVLLCGRNPGAVATDHGWPIVAEHGIDALTEADTVIVPAFQGFLDGTPPDVTAALRVAHERGSRIVSICTGAFALAEAGVLEGKRATTHWYHAVELARRHPGIEVVPDELYVDEGDVLTSAGVMSGVDLCLHLLRNDRGVAAADEIARAIVAAPGREGWHPQVLRRLRRPEPSGSVADTQVWAISRLEQTLTVRQLATHAQLPLRTFERRFVAETGTTPMRWLNAARVDRARELLETTDATIDRIADACGLGTPTNLRQHFRRATGTSPREYRRRFTTH